jgi:hypothetical protein
MVRHCGLICFISLFLNISPSLRQAVLDGVHAAGGFASHYGPFSFIALGALAFVGVGVTLQSGQHPR